MSMSRRSSRRTRSPLGRYLGRTETVLVQTRQHPLSILSSFTGAMRLAIPLMMVAWGVAGVPLLRNAVGDIVILICYTLTLAMLGRCGWAILEWECARVFITNEKVVYSHGVLSRQLASTPLSKVSELAVRQTLVGRVLDYGSLVVDVPGGRAQALHGLRYIPDPARIYRTITDAVPSKSIRREPPAGADLVDLAPASPLDAYRNAAPREQMEPADDAGRDGDTIIIELES